MLVLGDFQTSVRKALTEIDPHWESYDGLIVCGSHAPKDTELMIREIQWAREENIPYLGICLGHQLAAIQWARDSGIPDATSEEFGTGTFVVKKREGLNVGLKDGESYWNNYEVVIDWVPAKRFYTCQFHPEYQSSKEKPHPLLKAFLDDARPAQCHWSASLGALEATHQEVWGTREYVDRNQPAVFFGMYDLRDYLKVWRHKGRKWILWAGSDIRNLASGFIFNDGKLYWLSKGIGLLRTQNLVAWLLRGAEHWVENEWEEKELEKCGLEVTGRRPSYLGKIDLPITYRPKFPMNVYVSSGKDRQEEYGFGVVERIAKDCPFARFHLYGAPWETKQENVIVHGRVPKDQMNEETSKMQCGLRLNETDGFSEILAKAVLRGQYAIGKVKHPMIPTYENDMDLILELHKISKMTEPNPAREFYRENLNTYPWA